MGSATITYIRIDKWLCISEPHYRCLFTQNRRTHALRKDLAAEGCLIALKMALLNRSLPNQPLIHHSDRGSQYCCKEYVDLLGLNNTAISMTNNGDPYDECNRRTAQWYY